MDDLDAFVAGFPQDASRFVPFARSVEDIRAGVLVVPRFTLGDLVVRGEGDVRVATFTYAVAAGQLGRRTLVPRRDGSGWRVLHIHGSNATE